MNNLKQILTLAFSCISVLVFAQNVEKSTAVVFSGKVDPKYDGEYVHIYNNINGRMHDSTMVKNGAFNFIKSFKEPTIFSFFSNFELRTKKGYGPLHIPVDAPSTINIDGNMAEFSQSIVKGSRSKVSYDQISSVISSSSNKIIDTLIAKYGREVVYNRTPDTSSLQYKNMMTDYNLSSKANNTFIIKELSKFIAENPNSFISTMMLSRNAEMMSMEQLETLSRKLTKSALQGHFGSQLNNIISGRKASAVGKVVQDFTLNDQHDQALKFSKFKGKYLLIDFWGSWCGPCHVAFKELRKLYANYQPKGFEILGIATERGEISAWKKDIEKEQLPWPQMLDVTGDKNISSKMFAVNKYPTTVLISPEGKILGRDLSIPELEAILSKL